MMFRKILIPLFFISLFISCTSDDTNEVQNELDRNRQLWETKKIDNYKWNERLTCGNCLGLVFDRNVFVVNKVKDRVTFDETVLPANVNFQDVYDNVFNNSKTVEEAFDFIEELLTQEIELLVIEYDEAYGYPTLISIDYMKRVIDDERTLLYSDFEIIN